MAEDITPRIDEAGLSNAIERIDLRMRNAQRTATAFGRTMSEAFSQSIIGGRSFEDVLKSLTLRISEMALKAAFKPIEQGLVKGIGQLFNFSPQLAAAGGAIKPFAAGGVIGTPTYFPMTDGGVGLAGEAGPEAIMPLTRGADGKLGVMAAGGARSSITVNISTPDADSFRRSEIYLTGQIARAVARGQRGL
jgi:phage-related minor tail protein